MLLGILFNICLVASNLLETKVIQVFGITATAGLIVFPISYIINDCIAEVWGFKKARLIIWSGFISNFLVIGFAQLAVMLPAAPFWEGEEGFNFVFGMAPRIAIASLMAFLVGSFLNAYVMSKMKIASAGKNFSLRAIVSTLVGESADSMIFFPIAFIIRKTKCFDFWERNVLFPKTKRSFFRTPKHPLPCPFPLNFSLLIITKKFGNLAKNRYICIV